MKTPVQLCGADANSQAAKQPRPGRILLGLLLLGLARVAHGGESNSLAGATTSAIPMVATDPRALAVQYEREGRKVDAAALYEAMARTNATARKVLAQRLVTIYIETGETNKALTWAQEVMRENPDPKAYLAAVHARLGQEQAAREILEREIARNTNMTRAVTLRWQLADVYGQQGEAEKSRGVLEEAARLAKGTPMEATTQRRLKTQNGGKK